MNKIIDEKSANVLPAGIDYFSLPPTTVGIVDGQYIELPPVNAISQGSPIEFRFYNEKYFLDLSKTYIAFTCSIRDVNGQKIPLKYKDENDVEISNPEYAVANTIAKTLFRQFTVSVNSTLVSDSGVNYAYKSAIMNELSYDQATKENVLGLAGYTREIDPETGLGALNSAKSAGFKKRVAWMAGGKSREFMATIDLDIFSQPKYIPSFVDLRVMAYLNNPEFTIDQYELKMAHDPYMPRIYIESIKLFLYRIELHDSTAMALESAWKERVIPFPLKTVAMRTFFIAPGRFDLPQNVLFSSHTPRRVVCALVDADSYNGKYTKTPFNFQTFSMSEICLEIAGKSIPARGMKVDFENDNYSHAMMSMIEGMGISRKNVNNGLSVESFKEGKAFFVFEVMPQEQDEFTVLHMGNTTLRIQFSKAISGAGVYCLVLGEFDTILSLDSNRNAIVQNII